MRQRLAATVLALLTAACATDDGHGSSEAKAHVEPKLSWEQLAFGCSIMGAGEAAHVMCNHGHSLSLHNENLYERLLYLRDHGVTQPTEAELMHGLMPGHAGVSLPPPLSPILRARLGERVRLRVVAYGPQFHTFHLHGHLWLDGGKHADTQTLGPAEVYDAPEFFAGAGATSDVPRAGVGDWMYHCHVETHMATGMWGLFRVLPKDGSENLGQDGRFPHEVPPPLGGPGQTVDVWVVAAEVPLAVARAYVPAAKELVTVEREARLYVPVADEATFLAANAKSIRKTMEPLAETWTPWILSLKKGTTVRVHLRNVMPDAPVSLHPHGVAYDAKNDGTLPENVVLPGGAPVTYTWTADTPGTWPLHDHAKTLENLGRGLFAAIVVKDDEEIQKLQRDYVVFLHDYDMDWMMGSAEPTGAGH